MHSSNANPIRQAAALRRVFVVGRLQAEERFALSRSTHRCRTTRRELTPSIEHRFRRRFLAGGEQAAGCRSGNASAGSSAIRPALASPLRPFLQECPDGRPPTRLQSRPDHRKLGIEGRVTAMRDWCPTSEPFGRACRPLGDLQEQRAATSRSAPWSPPHLWRMALAEEAHDAFDQRDVGLPATEVKAL